MAASVSPPGGNRNRSTEPAAEFSTTDALLRVLIGVTARVAIPGPRLRALVVGRNARSGDKYVAAYNLCDGSRGVTEVARLSGLDQGNLSRAIARWIEDGVMFKLGSDTRPVHLYRWTTSDGDEDTVITDESAGSTGPPGPTANASRRGGGTRNTSKGLLELPLDESGRNSPRS